MLPAFAMALIRCANPVAPTGGPKDEQKPLILKEEPANYTQNFSGHRIDVSFDEYIQLKNINKNLLVSPPMDEDPVVKVKGRTLEIRLPDSLRANTTYTLYFSEAIADITEGNSIRNYSYVFSTGDSIDMGGLSGRLVDAFKQEPLPDVNVMLYRGDDDSLPLKERPWYLSRTDDKGEFSFGNIAISDYRIFALVDDNSNLRYDLPSEKIGFLDTLITPYRLLCDTDSVTLAPVFRAPRAMGLSIPIFDEEDPVLKVVRASMAQASLAEIEFNRKGGGRSVRPLSPVHEGWMRSEHATDGDTLRFWLTDPLPDTLLLEVSVQDIPIDTVRLLPRRTNTRGRSGGPTTPTLAFSTPWSVSKKLPPSIPLAIDINFPVNVNDTTGLLLLSESDTVVPDWGFRDDSLRRHIIVRSDWKEDAPYTLLIHPHTFTGINGLEHDTIRLPFRTASASDFGTLSLALTPGREIGGDVPVIVDLLDGNGKVVRQAFSRTSSGQEQTISFGSLPPGDYSLRAIADLNGNGWWDPGDYFAKRQPEPVIYMEKKVNVKANWELALEWKL